MNVHWAVQLGSAENANLIWWSPSEKWRESSGLAPSVYMLHVQRFWLSTRYLPIVDFGRTFKHGISGPSVFNIIRLHEAVSGLLQLRFPTTSRWVSASSALCSSSSKLRSRSRRVRIFRGSKGDINMRISPSGSRAQYWRDTAQKQTAAVATSAAGSALTVQGTHADVWILPTATKELRCNSGSRHRTSSFPKQRAIFVGKHLWGSCALYPGF